MWYKPDVCVWEKLKCSLQCCKSTFLPTPLCTTETHNMTRAVFSAHIKHDLCRMSKHWRKNLLRFPHDDFLALLMMIRCLQYVLNVWDASCRGPVSMPLASPPPFESLVTVKCLQSHPCLFGPAVPGVWFQEMGVEIVIAPYGCPSLEKKRETEMKNNGCYCHFETILCQWCKYSFSKINELPGI